MLSIESAAISINNGDFSSLREGGYVANNPNNFLLTMFCTIIYAAFHTIFVPLKLINIFCSGLITFFAYKIYQKISNKDHLFTLLLLAFFPAGLFYANQAYSDVLAAMLFTCSVWYYIKNKTVRASVVSGLMLAMGTILRPVGVVYLVAIILFSLVLVSKFALQRLVIFLVTFSLFTTASYITIRSVLGDSKSLPVWSYIYMGFNEQKFGFQDASHSTTRSVDDVVSRIKEMGPSRTSKILAKKVVWTWTENTYAIERYGVGIPGVATYSYVTPLNHGKLFSVLSKFVYYSTYTLMAVALCSAAYYIWFGQKKSEIALLLLSICLGFLIFYALWEIKSRYLYPLYPFMIMFLSLGLQELVSNTKQTLKTLFIHKNRETLVT